MDVSVAYLNEEITDKMPPISNESVLNWNSEVCNIVHFCGEIYVAYTKLTHLFLQRRNIAVNSAAASTTLFVVLEECLAVV